MTLTEQIKAVRESGPIRVYGRVAAVKGLSVIVERLPAPVGAACVIQLRNGARLDAEVIGFEAGRTVLMPLGDADGVMAGNSVFVRSRGQRVGVGETLLGRVIDACGRPIDGKGPLSTVSHRPIRSPAPGALDRRRIDAPLGTGIRAIDSLLTVGLGQRIGVFAGTGVGKSVLLGMIAQYTSAEVVVAALVGERAREVQEFIERDLGSEGLARSVIVVSTSDQSPVLRLRASHVATSIAESFRDQGRHVLLLMDSITRVAMAQRQIGLAGGEPPTSKGYPPSTFSLLAGLLERTGQSDRGSITGIYTVLVEGDDIDEPISDAARGILDGHILLDRELANRGHYPAISILQSISRVMPSIVDPKHLQAAMTLKRLIAAHRDIEDLVKIGAYTHGQDAEMDLAVRMKRPIDAFLTQQVAEAASFESTKEGLMQLLSEATRAVDSADSTGRAA